MKKILFSVFAMAAMLFATSCSQEEDFNLVADGTEVAVSFSAELPQIATRTYSDGKSATNLVVAFYEEGSDVLLFTEEATFSDLKATVKTTLATGKLYDVIFWATAPDNKTYKVDFAKSQTMTVDYNQMNANDENNDAFYAVETFKLEGAMNKDVELHRPFAQVNLGTNDYAAAERAGLKVTATSLTTTVANTLDFISGEVTGEDKLVVFKETLPNRAEKYPVDNYEYLEMNYLLVGEDQTTTDMTFYVRDEKLGVLSPAIVVSNVPVQRNYRTNIYGALLTDPATFNVEIKPAYEDEDNNVEIWDSKAEPVQPNEDGVYVVENASQLAWVAQQLSAKNITEGTIQLAADIYLDGSMWTPINIWNPENAGVITFDGQGHTINGMTVKGGADLGFFGNVAQNLVIKNVTFTSPVIESTSSFVGAVFGKQYANVELENINVVDGQFSTSAKKGIKVAGLIGQSNAGQSGTTLAVNNCKVEGSTFTAYHSACGLIGYVADNAATITNCQSNNNTFYYSDDRSLGGHPWANYCTPGNHNDGPVDATCTTEGNKGFLVVANGVMKNDAGEYEISNANGMAWVAAQVNSNGKTFAGETVKLTEDINLANQLWAPIGKVVNYPSYTFAGTFDGNSKTISNLNASASGDEGFASAGLFGSITGEVKDLTVKDATITSSHYAAAIVGYISQSASITNCHVDGATITSAPEKLANGSYDNGDKVGGIVGYAHKAVINGCTVKNATIQGYRDLGGIAGYLSDGTATNNSIETVTINVSPKHNYKNYTSLDEYDANSIIGEGEADSSNTGVATINFLELSVEWASTAYGVTAENPYGVLATVAEASSLEEGWRLPTKEEVDELIANSTWTKTTQNGVAGWLVKTNLSGTEIFLPALTAENAPISDLVGKIYYLTSTVVTDFGPVALTDLNDYIESAAFWEGFDDQLQIILVKD